MQEDWRLWLALSDLGWRTVHVDETTAIYHRIPHTLSMTNQTGSELAALERFVEGTRWVWKRWPVDGDSAIERCHALVTHMYATSQAQLRRGERLSHYRYEHSLPILWQALHGTIGYAESRSLLERAVTGAGRMEEMRTKAQAGGADEHGP